LVNLLSLSDWYLRAANLMALAVLWIVTAYVFTVLAALDVHGLRAQLVSALMLGIGSLHWTILGTTAVVIGYGLMLRFAVPLLALFGVGLPAAVFAAICSRILRDLEPSSAEEPHTSPRPLARPATRTVARSRRPSSVSDPVRPVTKGTPACSLAGTSSRPPPSPLPARSRSRPVAAAAAEAKAAAAARSAGLRACPRRPPRAPPARRP